MTFPALHVLGVAGLPDVRSGDDLVALTVAAIERSDIEVAPGDVFVVTQKIVSKAEGRLVLLETVRPSPIACAWAESTGKDARLIELALSESIRILRMERGILIVETRHGFVCANAGVDASNVPQGWVSLLPTDPDGSARRMCSGLRSAFGCPLGVIVTDTFGRPWREGQTNVAIGIAGLQPLINYRGVTDPYGHRLLSTAIAVADELASAAEIVMGKTRGVPVALVKGAGVQMAELDGVSARTLARKREEDLFR